MARNGYKKISTSEDKEIVSFVSLLLFQWMNSIFKIGSERPLDENDFLPLQKEDSASFLTDQLQANWNKEKTKCNRSQNRPKLWKSVIKLISVKDAMIIVLTSILKSVSRLLQPLFLGYLISILMSAEPQKNNLLYGCTVALFANAFIRALSMHQHDYRCELLGIRISCALKGLIYHKTLLLAKDALLKFTTGQVINLISNDVQRMEEDTVMWLSTSISSCFLLVAIAVLLVYLIGWQSLMGVFFLFLFVPFFAGFSYISAVLRLRTAAVSDRRISLLNQVVSGIRAIKTRAWGDEYRKKIEHIRR